MSQGAQLIDSMRRLDYADGDTPEMTTVLELVADHGQLLDWIFRGDVGVMICDAAATY